MIRFVNERICAVRVAMTHTTILQRLTIEMVHRVVILMNHLSQKGSLQRILSP